MSCLTFTQHTQIHKSNKITNSIYRLLIQILPWCLRAQWVIAANMIIFITFFMVNFHL